MDKAKLVRDELITTQFYEFPISNSETQTFLIDPESNNIDKITNIQHSDWFINW